METPTAKPAIKKFFVRGRNVWISRHDALALNKILRSCDGLSDSTRRRLRKTLLDEIVNPLYLYTLNCTQCGCKLDFVYDKLLSLDEVKKKNAVKGIEDLGIVCAACVEDYK
jgi:hypothetical protein